MPSARFRILRLLPPTLLFLLSLLALSCGNGETPPSSGGGAEESSGTAPQPPDGAPAAEAKAVTEAEDKPRGSGGADKSPLSEEAAGTAAHADADEVVCLVNGDPITRGTLDTQLSFQLNDSPFGDQTDEFRPASPSLEQRVLVLDILIKLELAAREAMNGGFAPDGEELNGLVKEAMENYGGEEELARALSESGESMDDFTFQIKRNAALKNWRDAAFLENARVTDSEAEEYYNQHIEDATHAEEVNTLQIMFPLPFSDTGQPVQREKIRAKAEEALALAKNGANFEDLIPLYMDQTTLAASNNGRMGWVARGATFPQLEEDLFALKPGEISEILETPFSLHILKAVDTRPPGVIPFQELKPEIVKFLSEQKIDALVQERINELMETADVKITDPELSSAWEEYRRQSPKTPEPAPEGGGD
ncbi:MAG: peptidyl-prolyl cis-trans isomerase [Deltaproteobacteria bacterium]|jgi:parvulin-like peptidyl-prolyl isomerase|nr:peptidyl-prolyl cis-trans isomerase [Deltaproteobacteria bacterium]